MRDFLIVFPFAYLVDVWPIWAAALIFNLWYRQGHDHPLLHYLFQTLGAILLALFLRSYKSRRPVFWQSIAKGRLLANLVIATAAGFLATFAHSEVIELTGSPSPDQIFYVGRLLSMVAVCFVLVVAYCVAQIIYQSEDTLKNLAPGPLGDASRQRHASNGPTHHRSDDALYLELAVIQTASCMIDLINRQAARFTWIMFGLLAGVLVLFSSCNLCWSRAVRVGNAAVSSSTTTTSLSRKDS